MFMVEELKWSSMLLSEGCLDILQYLKENKTAQFKDLSKLKNRRTGKPFSPNTLSSRLDDLEEMEAISIVAVKTDRKRSLGYEITEKGNKIIEVAANFEMRLKQIVEG